MKTICSLLIVVLLMPLTAWSQSDDQKLAEEMAKGAGEAALRELGFNAIEDLVNAGVQSAPAPGEQSTGASVVGWIKIGLAANDYSKAKNDKQRLFAAGDAGAAALTMACPPAGIVATAALLVTKLVDMHLSREHAKELMKIAERTAEHIKEMVNIYRQMGESEAVRYIAIHRGMGLEHEKINQLAVEISQSCEKINARSTEEEILSCHYATAQIYVHIHNFFSYAQEFAQFKSRLISTDQYFEKMGIDRKVFVASLAEKYQAFQKAQSQARESQRLLGEFIAEAAVRQAMVSGRVDSLVQLRNECFRSALRFNRLGQLQSLRFLHLKSEENRIKLIELYSNAAIDEGCMELLANEQDPLFGQLLMRKKTLSQMEELLEVTQ